MYTKKIKTVAQVYEKNQNHGLGIRKESFCTTRMALIPTISVLRSSVIRKIPLEEKKSGASSVARIVDW